MPELKSNNLRSTLVWLTCLLAWLVCAAWLRPLAFPDEGRYAGVAWEMVRTGNWLTPMLNGMPFFHKPPLFYWLTAAAYEIFGFHLLTARMASVLGALLGAGALFALVRRWVGADKAKWASLVLVTFPFYFGGAQYANLDMLVAGCITAAIASAAHAVWAAEQGLPRRWSLWGAYAAAALGVLAKGLIGLVLPGAVVVLWLLVTGRWRRILGLLSLPGLLLFAGIAAPWFLWMQKLYPGFYDYFFVYQHFRRYTQTGFNNAHPIWYYLPLTAALTLPWWPVWLSAWRQAWQGRAVQPGVPGADDRPAGFNALMWIWLAVILVFFSLPASKLPGYVLPALPPLAFLMADHASRAFAGRWWGAGRALVISAAVSALTCLGLIGVALKYDQQSARPMVSTIQTLQRQNVPLVFVEEFAYDLPLYLALPTPVIMFADWQDPEIPHHDNDQKELFDAGVFDPAMARQVLVNRSQWPAFLCRYPKVMAVGATDAVNDYAELADTSPAVQIKRKNLWVLDRQTLMAQGLKCPSAERGLP